MILLLTHSSDTYVPDVVAHAIKARGGESTRIDTDRFPQRMKLTLGKGSVIDGIDLSDVRSAWIRRVWPARSLDVEHADLAATQARDAFLGALELVRCVNPLTHQMRAERKVLQLDVAKRVGLAMPRTVITNDPDAVRALDFPLVTKLLVPLSQTMDGSGPFVHTSVVDREDLAHIDSVRHAPQIFQERIEKRLDVRVVVVGSDIFAARTETDEIDWRTSSSPWRECEVPDVIASRSRRLLRDLGLTTGALDFVVDKQGTWWFLEINPAGEWGWLEKDVGLRISHAIARVLLS